MIVLVAALLCGRDGPMLQVSRLLGAAATLGEAASSVASTAINATNTLAATATGLVAAVAQNSLSISDNLWHWIDLLNVSARRCSGSITADSGNALAEWIHSPHAARLLPCADAITKQTLIAAAQSVTLSIPDTQTKSEDLATAGYYGAIQVAAALLTSGQVSWNGTFDPDSLVSGWNLGQCRTLQMGVLLWFITLSLLQALRSR